MAVLAVVAVVTPPFLKIKGHQISHRQNQDKVHLEWADLVEVEEVVVDVAHVVVGQDVVEFVRVNATVIALVLPVLPTLNMTTILFV